MGQRAESMRVAYNPNLVDIAKISPDQTNRLRERVATSNGSIRAFIHPFYENNVKTQCYRDHLNGMYPKIDDVSIGLHRLLHLQPNKTPPIFVFEEQRWFDQTAERILEMNIESGNIAYMVPTQRDTSSPRFSPIDTYDENEKNWRKLILYFHEIGIQKILIGGMRLTITSYSEFDSHNQKSKDLNSKDWRDQGIFFSLCVGNAFNHLVDDFEVDISYLTHPHSKADLELIIRGHWNLYTTPPRVIRDRLDYG